MKVLRTPDAAFENLAGYDFTPNYMDIAGGALRIHYVDEGPKTAQPIIMMHGEPSWSYLYRKMIKAVSAAGFRVIAPDLIGFGKSDKPSETSDYSYSNHMAWMSEWFKGMALDGAVLFCQDWGGLLGLRLVAENPDAFAGVIAGNTFLPVGTGKVSPAFAKWREFSQTVPVFPTGGVIRGGTVKPLDAGAEDAYNAPYPDESYKAGARIFPALVPTSPEMDGVADNVKAWEVLSEFNKPFLTCFSDQDPVTGGMDKIFHKRVPGCTGQAHVTLEGGGHFLQEDLPDELSEIIIKFCAQL
ncbi:MAG: haloalkane dehalogenase [Maricaulaceae bacterium]